MSKNDKGPDGSGSESNGRSFGRYRIINQDEMPRLRGESSVGDGAQEDQAENAAGGSAGEDAARKARRSERLKDEEGIEESPQGRLLDGGQERSGQRKGSCPSWLKSRVYKGGRPGGTEKGLLELQELIIRRSPVGIAVFDNRGRLRIRNDSFMEVIGLDSEDSVDDIDGLGKRFEDFDLSDKFWDVVETGSTVEFEEKVRIADVGETTIHMAFHPVSLPSGISWCICYFDRPSAGASGSGHLQDYQSYAARLAMSSGDAMIGLDLNGTVRFWNEGCEALFGFTEDEIVGQSVFGLIPDDLRREAQLVLKVVLEKGVYRNFDTYRLTKSGERIPVTLTISAVRDEGGKVIGTAATCRDLRGARDLHEKALEAQKLNAVLQMAVAVYHRINDPLCVISANAQLLMPHSGEERAEDSKKLKSILDSAKRISAVLDDLTRITGVEPQMALESDEEGA